MNKRLAGIFLLLILASPPFLMSPKAYSTETITVNITDVIEDGYAIDGGGAASTCNSTGVSKVTDSNAVWTRKTSSVLSDPCWRLYFVWNISAIPDTATILSVNFSLYQNAASQTSQQFFDITPLIDNGTRPDLMSYDDLWDEIEDGDNYNVTDIFRDIGYKINRHLGGDVVSDLQANLANDWFGFGVMFNNPNRTATTRYFAFTGSEYAAGSETTNDEPELHITYQGSAPVTVETEIVIPDLDFDPIMFVDRFYRVEQTVLINGSNIDTMRVRFSDGYTYIYLTYSNVTETFSIQTTRVKDGAILLDYAVLDRSHSYVEEDVTDGNRTITAYYVMKLSNRVQDALGVDIYGWFNTSSLTYGWNLEQTDYFDIYNHGGWIEWSSSGDAGRTVGGDTFEIWAREGGWVAVNQTWYHLEHYHAQFAIRHSENGTGEDQYWQDETHVVMGEKHSDKGDWILDVYWYYFDPVDKVFVKGWTGHILMEEGDEGNIEWTNLNVTWYNSLGVAVKTDSVNAFIEEEPKAQVRLWMDLWFNKMNASTTHGGRITSMYYPINLVGDLWWAEWVPLVNMTTQSMYFDDNLDNDGNLIPSQNLELVKVGFNLSRPTTASGEQNFMTELLGFQISEFNLAESNIVDGVDTPIYVDTKVPDLPVNSFLAPIYTALKMLGDTLWSALTYAQESIWQAIKDRWPWFTDAWENSVGTLLNFAELFNSIWGYILGFIAFLSTVVDYIIWPFQVIASAFSYIQQMFSIFTGVSLSNIIIIFILIFFGYGSMDAAFRGDLGWFVSVARTAWNIAYTIFNIFYVVIKFMVDAILGAIPG